MENTSVTTVDNNAIGGKSAKWANAHLAEWVPGGYDAIFVMLGTNDRWDCSSVEKFYTEYSQFLHGVSAKCTYLTVFTPIPAFNDLSSEKVKNFTSRQAADTVLNVCETNGYPCINLYDGLQQYATETGTTLDEFFFGSTHPSHHGYLMLWRLIARELGLNLDIEMLYDKNDVLDVNDIGVDRSEITETTALFAVDSSGTEIFPKGVSIYGTSTPFKSDSLYGGTVVTYRYDSAGKQIYKPFYVENDFIRYAGKDGQWGAWHITNRDQFSQED